MSKQLARLFSAITAVVGAIGVYILLYNTLIHKLADGYTALYSINHFYSFFTCLINTLVVICLACYVIFPSSRFTRWFVKPVNNAAVGLYILIVGLIFYLLLYSTDAAVGWELLATHLVHGFVPISYFVLWFFRFRQGALKYQHCVEWLIVPMLYFIYILGRGELLLVYPYFFLNALKYGYGQVLINALGILMIFLMLGAGLVKIDQYFPTRQNLS